MSQWWEIRYPVCGICLWIYFYDAQKSLIFLCIFPSWKKLIWTSCFAQLAVDGQKLLAERTFESLLFLAVNNGYLITKLLSPYLNIPSQG